LLRRKKNREAEGRAAKRVENREQPVENPYSPERSDLRAGGRRRLGEDVLPGGMVAAEEGGQGREEDA
jgi:hypothetical protein